MVTDKAIQHAFSIANKAALSREELDDQEHREMFIQDQRGALSQAEKQGLQEGRKEGLVQGMEKGSYEATINIARSLLGVLDDNVIASSTGLSIDKTQRLRQN